MCAQKNKYIDENTYFTQFPLEIQIPASPLHLRLTEFVKESFFEKTNRRCHEINGMWKREKSPFMNLFSQI